MIALRNRALRSLIVLLLLISSSYAQNAPCKPDNAVWANLLAKYVNASGEVDYLGFIADSTKLNAYLHSLSSCPPHKQHSESEQLAYWINTYNAFTIKLIVQHYPVASIRDIRKVGSVWDMKFFRIGDEQMSLNDIEHQILRKRFKGPRIHFAIVCASRSCPTLRNEPYEALKLEQQLEAQAKQFINDATKNQVSANRLQLSSIFKWFGKDFTTSTTLVGFIGKYSDLEFADEPKVSYLDYDWSLNEWKRDR